MKNKLNKKGFTLVELLAVIVVLAIIMVIATTQINSTIKKSRGDSFYDSVLVIERNAKLICVQGDEITPENLKEMSDISEEDYTITVDKTTGKIAVKGTGKFNNMTLPTTLKSNITSSDIDTLTITLTDCFTTTVASGSGS